MRNRTLAAWVLAAWATLQPLSERPAACLCAEEPAGGKPAPASAKPTEVWRGYVWKDEAGRLRLGYGVVAMGVMAYPPHIVTGPAATALAPYAVAKEDYVFWNYDLERPDDQMLAGLPTALVRLVGEVEEGADPAPEGSWPKMAPRTMRARVTSIEFVRPDWLRAWALFFRDKASPWRVARDVDASEEARRAFAPKALAALRALLAVPAPTEADRAKARALDPECRVAESFRKTEEQQIQRWLVAENQTKGWNLPGLDALPPLPPDRTQIQGWFLDSPTKAAFLERVAQAYTGDLERLELIHYVESANSTSYAEADLSEVKERWSEADYQRHRATSAKMGLTR